MENDTSTQEVEVPGSPLPSCWTLTPAALSTPPPSTWSSATSTRWCSLERTPWKTAKERTILSPLQWSSSIHKTLALTNEQSVWILIKRETTDILTKGQWQEIFKKLKKKQLTLCAGPLLNKRSHVQTKIPMNPIEKNCFTDVKKPLRQSSYDFHQILVQRLHKWVQRWGTQPLQSKEIKISSTVWFTRFTKELSNRQWFFYQISEASTLVQWAKSREKHPRKAVSNCKSKKGFFSQCCVLE